MIWYDLLGKKVVFMECCMPGSKSLESEYSILKFHMYWLTLIIEDAKMSPNSMCWKNEETLTVGECIHCSDYEEVSYNSNSASSILSASENWYMQSGKHNNWTNSMECPLNVDFLSIIFGLLQTKMVQCEEVYCTSGCHQSNDIE